MRAEVANPHGRLAVRPAACVTNARSHVVVVVAACLLLWVLERGCVEARNDALVEPFPMRLSVPPALGAFLVSAHEEVAI